MSVLLEEQDRLTRLLEACPDFEYKNPHRTKEEHEKQLDRAKYNLEEVTVAIPYHCTFGVLG